MNDTQNKKIVQVTDKTLVPYFGACLKKNLPAVHVSFLRFVDKLMDKLYEYGVKYS